jgi:hypothetical protein
MVSTVTLELRLTTQQKTAITRCRNVHKTASLLSKRDTNSNIREIIRKHEACGEAVNVE